MAGNISWRHLQKNALYNTHKLILFVKSFGTRRCHIIKKLLVEGRLFSRNNTLHVPLRLMDMPLGTAANAYKPLPDLYLDRQENYAKKYLPKKCMR